MDILAFEYQPPRQGDPEISLHYNFFGEDGFDSRLFSNDYHPLAVIDYQVTRHHLFDRLCDWLRKNKPSVKEAAEVTSLIVAKIMYEQNTR